MEHDERIVYHCKLVVEYKDVDAIFSLKNLELVRKLFFEQISSQQNIPYTLFYVVFSTVVLNSKETLSLSKQDSTLIEPPSTYEEFESLISLINDYSEHSVGLFQFIVKILKQRMFTENLAEQKELIYTNLSLFLKLQDSLSALECAVILKTFFHNSDIENEELNTTILALLIACGANELVKTFHQYSQKDSTIDTIPIRMYNVFLSLYNLRKSEEIEKLYSELESESYPRTIQKYIDRIYALHLSKIEKNNEAKIILEQLAQNWFEEKNTKEYLKIHNDIVSIVPNESVETFSEYIQTIEHLFENAHSKEYLLNVYAKKHEYAKLHKKYEAISLAKAFLLASSIKKYSFLEDVAFQLSELSKKRKKTVEALDFLSISLEAKTKVYEVNLVDEKRKSTAEKLILQYLGNLE